MNSPFIGKSTRCLRTWVLLSIYGFYSFFNKVFPMESFL